MDNTKQNTQNSNYQFFFIDVHNNIQKIIDHRLKLRHPPDLCIINVYSKKKFSIIDKREDHKKYYFQFFGVQTFPQNLSVFLNSITPTFQNNNKSRTQCIFYIRDQFQQVDLIVQINIPGGTKLSVLQYDGNRRPANTDDLERCYASSILRYILSILYDDFFDSGYTIDPFFANNKKLHDFLEILFKITKSKDIKIYKKLWYEEMLKNIKNGLYLVYLYIKLTKKTSIVKRFYKQNIRKDPDYLRKNIHLIQFYVQVFLCEDASNENITKQQEFMTLKQILGHLYKQDPMTKYYISLMSGRKDEQIYILKNIVYANKNEIWLKLSNLYMNHKYSNFDLLAKSLIILDIITKKVEKQIKQNNQNLQNTRILIRSNNNQKIRFQYLSEIQRIPSKFTFLFDRNIKILPKQSQQSINSIFKLQKSLQRYRKLELIQKQVVLRLLRLISTIGKQKLSQLYNKTFNNIHKNMDTITMYDNSNQIFQPSFHQQSSEQQQYQKFPSFILQDKKIVPIIKYSKSDQDNQQLPRITQQTILTLRQDRNASMIELEQSISMQQIVQVSNKKRNVDSNFIELLNLSLDIKTQTDQVLKKLDLNQKKVDSSKLAFLKTETCMVIAQAGQMCNLLLVSAYCFISIKKRIVDMYSYHRLFKILAEIKDLKCQLLLLSDWINDMRLLGITEIMYLPIWIEEQFFNTLKRKGRVFVQNLLKTNHVNEPIISRSIEKYFELQK